MRSPGARLVRLLTLFFLVIPTPALAGSRIKDIVDVEDVRANQLIGYGLVVGLAGTGDRVRNAPFTGTSVQAMLEHMGVKVAGAALRIQNVAAVSVTATLPPFARAGSHIDVQVSALGDASSLQGGTLLITELRGLDGAVYAIAQGPVALSGFKAQGAAASISRGVATSARIAAGAIVEREVADDFASAQRLRLALRNPDFVTAGRIADVINGAMPAAHARADDPGTVTIDTAANPVAMIAAIERLEVAVDSPARIVVNEAAGTVVMTADVRVSPVAIAQGGLTIAVAERPEVSQPLPASQGKTEVVPRTSVSVDEGPRGSMAMVNGASLRQLVAGLNALGVTPRDLITILQAMKSAGALQAEIEVQ